MVLASKHSDNKKKKILRQLSIPSSFPYLIEQPKIQLFQLHQTIFQIGQDFLVYGRFSMVPVVASLNLLH